MPPIAPKTVPSQAPFLTWRPKSSTPTCTTRKQTCTPSACVSSKSSQRKHPTRNANPPTSSSPRSFPSRSHAQIILRTSLLPPSPRSPIPISSSSSSSCSGLPRRVPPPPICSWIRFCCRKATRFRCRSANPPRSFIPWRTGSPCNSRG